MELHVSIGRSIICALMIILTAGVTMGQDQTMVQLKTLDHQLKPYPGLQIVLNQGAPTTVDHNGTAFIEISSSELPPRTVKINDQKLEVESWNFSRGILEVVVRPKTYKEITAEIKDRQNRPLEGITVVYNANEPVRAVSNHLGIISMMVPVHHDLNSTNLFTVTGYKLDEIRFDGNQGYLKLSQIPQITGSIPRVESIKSFHEFNFDYLDSIKSLTVFYAVIRNTDLKELSDELKHKVDEKFYQLISIREDSLTGIGRGQFPVKITDSSLVEKDVSLLIEQALREQQSLNEIRSRFEENVGLLEEKLKDGGSNLSREQQLTILEGFNRLNAILKENEQKFYQNQAQYSNLLNILKSRLISIDELEEKLMLSELQLIEQSKDFSKKLLTAIAIALALGLFGTVSFILTRKFQKQKNQLAKANTEVKRVNERLEELVSERTAQLQETNQELDTFLYKSSHDLRRPLTTIVGLSNIASMTLKGDAFELFEHAADTARNMDRMLRKLINVNEINNPSKYSPIDFSTQVQKTIDGFQDLIKDRKIDIKSVVQADIGYHSYPDLIEIILQNLIENALFFSSVDKANRRPLVRVNITQQNGHISINLEDNGCGIDPSVKDKIWNMFFVGHEKSTGNGLGLYITRKAARTLNGEVNCQQNAAGHTVFEVRLPMNGSFILS